LAFVYGSGQVPVQVCQSPEPCFQWLQNQASNHTRNCIGTQSQPAQVPMHECVWHSQRSRKEAWFMWLICHRAMIINAWKGQFNIHISQVCAYNKHQTKKRQYCIRCGIVIWPNHHGILLSIFSTYLWKVLPK
jgi:hypothetical protein